MSDLVLGVVLGIIIGWLSDWLLFRKQLSGEADGLRTELSTVQAQSKELAHKVETGSAEIGALQNKLVSVQAVADGAGAIQSELDGVSADLTSVRAELAAAQAELAAAQADVSSAQADLAACNAAKAELSEAAAQSGSADVELEELRTKLANAEAELSALQGNLPYPDELQRIEGIGPKISGIFIAAGIRTFTQLANCTPEHLSSVMKEGGLTRINNPETWPEQAALAAAGNWDELEKLQDILIGGRRPS